VPRICTASGMEIVSYSDCRNVFRRLVEARKVLQIRLTIGNTLPICNALESDFECATRCVFGRTARMPGQAEARRTAACALAVQFFSTHPKTALCSCEHENTAPTIFGDVLLQTVSPASTTGIQTVAESLTPLKTILETITRREAHLPEGPAKKHASPTRPFLIC
jgi:hypothetical protein